MWGGRGDAGFLLLCWLIHTHWYLHLCTCPWSLQPRNSLVNYPSNVCSVHTCWRPVCGPPCVQSTMCVSTSCAVHHLCGPPCVRSTKYTVHMVAVLVTTEGCYVHIHWSFSHILPNHWSSPTETCSSLPHPLVHSLLNTCLHVHRFLYLGTLHNFFCSS